MKSITLSSRGRDGTGTREEEDDYFHCGPACVSFRKLTLVQGPCVEDDIQTLKPTAKTSAPELSFYPLSVPLSNQNHLEKSKINFLIILLKKTWGILFRLFKLTLSETEEISG